MRIACIAPAYPYRGGIAHFGVSLARELAKNHEVKYINFSRLYPGILFPGKTQVDNSTAPVTFPNDRIIDSLSPLSWIKAGHLLRNAGIQTAIFHWWHPFFSACYRTICKSSGRSLLKIAVCHNVLPHESGLLAKTLIRFGLAEMDGFVIHGSSDREEIEKIAPGRESITLFHPVYEIFPGEDIPKLEARKALGIEPDTRLVLYFGLIRPYKGVEVLLRALGRLGDIDGLKCLVSGEIYGDGSRIRELSAALPEGCVTLEDFYIPNEEVALRFRAADVVVLPYLSATQSGIVPVAYKCDRPVIVSRVGGLPDVVRDGESGFLVEPGDDQQLAAAIRRFFIDLDCPAMAEGIRKMRETLTWKGYAAKLEAFIGRLNAR